MKTFDELYAAVKDLPIVDWHNHLDLVAVTEDRPLGSLHEAWVKADPYKHRAMRICGEPERLITGDAPEAEKWAAWMRTLPKLVGNPLFAWARPELEFLGLDPEPYLHGRGEDVPLASWTPQRILRAFNVEWMSPCVGASQLKGNGQDARSRGWASRLPAGVCPSLRTAAGERVSREALEAFEAAGCRIVDISVDDTAQLAEHLASLHDVASFASSRGWTMLLHLGALRETSTRLRAAAGPAGGFAGMRAPVDPAAVAAFLNELERNDALPRTVLMSLNPEAHAQLAVLAGSFVGAGQPGKVQLGPAWWWCDHEEGIRDVLEKNAAYGVLSTFVGMTTDSRSLLSFVRHDYFRRVLCRWVAEKVAAGSFPDDEALLHPLLENVCYRNAKEMVS